MELQFSMAQFGQAGKGAKKERLH